MGKDQQLEDCISDWLQIYLGTLDLQHEHVKVEMVTRNVKC